jgi:hypothetical protein
MADKNPGQEIVRRPKKVLAPLPTSLIKRGMELARSLSKADPKYASFPKTTALHKALIAVTDFSTREGFVEWRTRPRRPWGEPWPALGAREYFAKWRRTQDFQSILIDDEHFLFVFTAFAAGADRTDATFRVNLAEYVLEPKAFTHPALEPFQDELAKAEQMPDTLMKTSLATWSEESHEVVPVECSSKTLAHFLRGLLMFVRWHNTMSDYPSEISEELARLDPMDRGCASAGRAVLCTMNAAHSAAKYPGDFERYILRNAIKNLNLGRIFDALDGLNFLRYWQPKWEAAGIGSRPNPKVDLIYGIAMRLAAAGSL